VVVAGNGRAMLLKQKNKTGGCLLSWVLLLTLTSCGTLSYINVDPDAEIIHCHASADELKQAVDSLANPLIDQKKTPGLVVGVLVPDGGRHFFGYGVTDKMNGRCPDENTLFAVGSVSKGFLSATVAILVQEGLLSWDNTLEELLPPGTKLSDDAKKITLLHLATHTSGLPRQPNTLKTLTYFIRYLFTGKSFYQHLDSDCLVCYLETFKAPKETLPEYSNIGYGLLTHISELHTGEKLDALVHRKIINPLELACTGYTLEELPGYDTRARGHAGDQPKFIRQGCPVPDWKFTNVMAGGSALYSNAGDLLTYANAYLRGSGDARIDRVLKDMLTVRFERPERAAAIAWSIDTISGRKIIYQIGVVGGYACYLGMEPNNQTAVVVLQNSLNWDHSIGHQILLRMEHGTR